MAGIKTANGGTITFQNYQGSIGYAMYVPEKVDENTPIFTYTYGGGQKDDWWSNYHEDGNYGPFDGLIANGGDSIVIMPAMDWGADWGENTMGIINSVREEYGITNLNVSGSGFSKGGFGGFDIVAANLKQNKNLDPQVVFFIDDYSSTYYMANHKLTNENAQVFTENNTVFFTFDPPWKSTDNYQTYLDAGINIIRVEPTNYDHIAINSNFFKNSIYDYMAGGTLPSEGYTYKVYNRKTGQWDVIEYEKIATIDRLYSFYGGSNLKSAVARLFGLQLYEFGSDSAVIEGYLNDIISKIKSSNFLNTTIELFDGSSTTSVPSQIPSAVQNYFMKVARNLESITSLTETIAKIDPTYQAIDRNLTDTVVEDTVSGSVTVNASQLEDKGALSDLVDGLENTAQGITSSFGEIVDNSVEFLDDFFD